MCRVAGQTVLSGQLLMKVCLLADGRKFNACRGEQTNRRDGMATYALRSRGTMKRHVAAEAVGVQRSMCRAKRTRTDHEVRPIEDQRPKPDEIGGDQRKNPAPLHFQLQNTKILMIWAIARTEKASVIG